MPLPSLLDPAATSPAAFGRNGPRALPPAAQKRYTVAADALGGTLAVQKQAQPNGEAGSLFSLMKVAEKIVEGKNHPAVRSWTTKLLDKHGNPKGAYARAKIILEALHPNGKSRWVPDPTGAEMIPGAHLILGDGDAPPYFALGDCFPQGTLVLGEGHTLRPIESLREGMAIWGLDRWSTVQRVAFKGELSVDCIRLSNGADVKLTADHHVYVLDCREHPMLDDAEDPKAFENADRCACERSARTEKRTRVSELRSGMLLPAPEARTRAVVRVERDVETVPCWDITTDDHRVYLPSPDVTVSQCDDLTTGWGAAVLVALMMLSAAESVGVRAAVVGHSYQKNGIIEHVLGALYDQGKWWYAEPSIPDMPFGEAKTPTREYVIEVPSLEVLCDAAVCLMPGGQASTAPPPPRRGDFLSVNGVTNPDPAEEAIGMNADNRALLDYADMTGICHATVTHARDVTLQEVLNQAQYAMWARAFVKTPDQPVLWHVPDFPVEQDRVAQSEIEVPWNDGIEPRTGANWTVPNSGFFPNSGDW